MNNYYKRGVEVKRGVMQAGVVAICRKFPCDIEGRSPKYWNRCSLERVMCRERLVVYTLYFVICILYMYYKIRALKAGVEAGEMNAGTWCKVCYEQLLQKRGRGKERGNAGRDGGSCHM